MSIREFVQQLEEQHISLRVADGQLKVVAAKNAVSGELLQQLKSRKDELLAFLSSSAVPAAAQIEPIEEQEYYAVSGAQKRIWIAEQLEQNKTAYIITKSCMLEKVNRTALEQSLQQLVNRHESLRTCFIMIDGLPKQRIVDTASFGLDYIEVSGGEEINVKQIEEHEVSLPFDLTKAPLMRARLVKTDDETYLFLLSVHHIVSDGWSMQVMMDELMQLYRQWPVVPKLAALPVQYKDYTAWQQGCIAEGKWKSSHEFWTGVLQDLPDTKMPATAATRSTAAEALPAVGSSANHEFRLSASAVSALGKLGKESGSSLFMVLLAIMKLLLYRYTGKTQLLAGIPVAGRNHPQLFAVTGFFVNVLPLKISFEVGDSFMAVLEKVKSALLLCLRHQDYPLEEIIQHASVPASGGRMSLFNVIVDYNKEEADGSVLSTSVKNRTSKFDFLVSFTEARGGISADIEYNTGLYDDWFVKQFAEHLQVLMEDVIARAAASAGTMLPFTAAETLRLTQGFNNTRDDRLNGKTVKAIFEEVVSKYGNSPAVVDHGRVLSYHALNNRANQLAWFMRLQKQVGPGDVVVVFMERSTNFITGTLAIVKTGSAYLYIDVEYPAERIAYLLQDVNAALILTDEQYVEKIGSIAGATPVIVVSDPAIAGCESSNPVCGKQSHDLAYIMYTSGSTGLPKGVMLQDSGVVRLAKDTRDINLNATDSLVLGGAVSFDAIILEMWPVLLNGGCLHLLAKDELLNAAILKGYLLKHDITTMFFTTSWFNQLVETDIEVFAPLKKIMIGGEKLSSRHARQTKNAFPHIQLVNAYGPTENTVVSATFTIVEPVDDNIPIGRPITNSEVYIVNNQMQLAPMGVWGQILVSGDGLARGYVGRPDLTEKNFIPHPFKQNALAYTTGDQGRWMPGGYVQYMGRMDEQLKIRGFRIEPGEIENAMQAHPDVNLAVVVVKEQDEQKMLVAFYTGAATAADIRSLLAKRLPAHMIPSRLVQLAQLPLNASGKADRKALLEIPLAPANIAEDDEAPTGLQAQMVAIWEKILQVKPVRVHDNFFEIGGHSLKAMQLIAEVYKQCGIQLTLGDVFARPTIASLCSLAHAEHAGGELIAPAPVQEYYELSHAQLRLWISSQHSSAKHAFNMPGVYDLKGSLDMDALNRSFDAIIQRHEILRTAFVVSGGRPMQKILPAHELAFSVNVQDVKDLDVPLDEWIHLRTEELFNLSQPPLFRVHLLQMENERALLIFVLHHIISDEWSTRVFVQDFARLYNAFSSNHVPALPPLGIQYKDYAYWHNQFLASSGAENYRKYWASQFSRPVPPLRLPADKPRPALKTYNGSRHSIFFGRQDVQKLEKIAQSENVTTYMLVLAIFKTLFYAAARQTDITIGVLSAARANASLQDQLGFYINNLPIRSRINTKESFAAFLQQVKTNAVQAFNAQLYPFDLIVENAGVQHQPDRSPLFDVMIQLLHEAGGVDAGLLQGIGITERDLNYLQTRYDLEITLLHNQARIACEIKYNTDIYARPAILLLGERLRFLVNLVVGNPLQTVDELALAVSTYFPSPLEEGSAYHPSLNYLFWSNKLQRFFASASTALDTPAVQRGPMQVNHFILSNKCWQHMEAVEKWMMALSAIALVLHKYGHEKLVLASPPDKNDEYSYLFFECDGSSLRDAAGLRQNFMHQFKQGMLYGNYLPGQLMAHLVLNGICSKQQVFESGVAIASIHATGSNSLENFRLLLLVNDTGPEHELSIHFDATKYEASFIAQLAAHFSKAIDFLAPAFSSKTALPA